MALFVLTLCITCAHSAFAQSTNPLQTIVSVHIDASTGNITVGSTTYPGANPGMHLLALKRQPNPAHLDAPDLVQDGIVTDTDSANKFLGQVLSKAPDALLIVNAVGNYTFGLNTVAQSLNQFGAAPDISGIRAAIPLVFIGSGGTNSGQAHQRGVTTANIDGQLAQDSQGNYIFIQPDYVPYNMTLDGNITVGQKIYTVGDSFKPGCNGSFPADSFRVVVVNRESLGLVANNSYCTAQSDAEIVRLKTDLATLTNGFVNESALVFIGSNGHPIPTNWNFGTGGDARIYPLAQEMAELGGYFETGVYLTPNDTYSLVGAVTPPSYVARPLDRAKESSSVYPDSPSGELHGVLARGVRGNWYSPLNADTSGVANLGLYAILAQVPVPFPHPSGSDELAAFQSISNQLCGSTTCNIRNQYDNLNIDLGTTYQTPLQAMTKDPSGNDCTNPANAGLPFCAVRGQLLTELKDVSNIRAFYGNLNDLWLANGTTSIYSLLSAYNNVKATIPAPPTADSPSLVGPLVNFFLGTASFAPVIGPLFGLADTAFNLGMDLTTDTQGNKTVDLTSTIGQLQDQAINYFKSQSLNTGTMFQLVYQDWGKIDALGTALASAQNAGSPWFWSSTTTAQMLNQMGPIVKQAAYQNLMAAAYAIGSYLPQTSINCSGNGPWPVWGQTPLWQEPNSYVVLDTDFKGCGFGTSPFVQSFNTISPAYVPFTYPTDSTNPYANDQRTSTILADFSWLGISLQTSPFNSGPNGRYDPPDSSLLSTLFTPVSQGGLGVYRPAFFEGWPFPRVTCDPSAGVRPPGFPGTAIGGCNWSSGTQALPAPSPATVTIQATQISTNQTEVDVLLTLSNGGTLPANSIDLTSISLRTLGGSGQATVLSPAQPILIPSLAAGDSTNVVLKLNIPAGVTKLEITEQGSIDLGQPDLSHFSDGQVLYPKN